MQTRPKILFITTNWLSAPSYGGQQRTLNLGRLLSLFGDVSYVILSVTQEDSETVRRTQQEFNVCRIVTPVSAISRGMIGTFTHRLRHDLDPTYMQTRPYSVTDSDRAAVEQLIRQHDVTWIHGIETANSLRITRWPSSVLDIDDVPSRVYQSSAKSAPTLLRRLLDLRMSWIWRRREKLFAKRFDVLSVCSEDDRKYLGDKPYIHVIPNGFHPQSTRCQTRSVFYRLGFIGSFDWEPNVNGMEWFLREVWPLVRRELPEVQLRLVGRKSDSYFCKLPPGVVGLGWLQDPSEEIGTWSAMAVPIKIGGGTRVKVVEAFARKCPVVATTLGAFGYTVSNGGELLLADSAEDFSLACLRLLRDPELGKALSTKAYNYFLKNLTWDSFEMLVRDVLEGCLSRNNQAYAGGVEPVGA